MSYQIIGAYDFEDGTLQGLASWSAEDPIMVVAGAGYGGSHGAVFHKTTAGGMSIASVPLGDTDSFRFEAWFKYAPALTVGYDAARVIRIYDSRGEALGPILDLRVWRTSSENRLYATEPKETTPTGVDINHNLGIQPVAGQWVSLIIEITNGQVHIEANGVVTDFLFASPYDPLNTYRFLHIGQLWSYLAGTPIPNGYESVWDDITVFNVGISPPTHTLTVDSNINVYATVNGVSYPSGTILTVPEGEVVAISFPQISIVGGVNYLYESANINGNIETSYIFQVLLNQDVIINASYVEEYIPPPPTHILTVNCNIAVAVTVNGVGYPAGSAIEFEENTLVTVSYPNSATIGGVNYLLRDILMDGVSIGIGPIQMVLNASSSIQAVYEEQEIEEPSILIPALIIGGVMVLSLASEKR